MALLHESVDSKKLDVRMVERNIARGVVKDEDLAKSLKSLPDDSENAEWVNIDTLTLDLDDSDSEDRAEFDET